MWSGINPEMRRQLKTIRQLVALQHQTPIKEWPLVFIAEFNALLVVREWADGSLTMYALPVSDTNPPADAQ